MKNKRFKNDLIILIVGGILLILTALFDVLYSLNTFNLQSYVSPDVIGYIAIGVTVIDMGLMFAFVFILNKHRERSDIKLANIVGADVKEAYMFGQIGLIVVNEEGNILWLNDLLQSRKLENLVNKNIYELYPDLKDLSSKDADYTITTSIDEYKYKVKFLKAAGLFILKDCTDYEYLYQQSTNQSSCIGIITIDNYNDIVGNDELANDIVSSVRNSITEYLGKYNCLIRTYRNDAYFIVMSYESLSEMIKEGFTVLDAVRRLNSKSEINPTLSIGIAYGYKDVVKMNEMASNALEVAMSRGGDQAVISKFGSDFEFIGGKSSGIEVGNKVKLRVFGDSLLSTIKKANKIIVMGHQESDMDSIGSCLGIKAIGDFFNVDTKVVFDPKSCERKTKLAISSMFSRDEISKQFYTPNQALQEVDSKTVVIVCDVSVPSLTLSPRVLDIAEKVIVIDHHRRGNEFIDSPLFQYVDTSASSTSEIISELLRYNSASERIAVNPIYATLMLSGIFLDSNFFKSKTTGSRTFEASMILRELGADNIVADDLLKDEYEEYALVNKIIKNISTPYYGVCICKGEEDEIIERSTLAKVGNQVIQLKGINACFVIGRTSEDEIRISARSDDSVNVQILLEKLGGGGHFSMAACAFNEKDIKVVEDKLLAVLEEFLNDARTSKKEEN